MTAASPGRTPHDRISGEQAALRRVATLVARAASPGEVFAAVAEEAGRVMDVDFTFLSRYDPDDTATIVASWSGAGPAFSVGTRLSLRGRNLHTLVFQTGQAARIEDYAGASGPGSDLAREFGLRAAVGVPISVEARLWGVMFVAGTGGGPLPAGTEARLAGFTELAATAIASAQARLELRSYAEAQAALRRVATLVGRAAPPEEVLAAVTAEAGQLLHAHHASLLRYDPDRAMVVAAAWGSTFPIGTRLSLGGRNVTTLVYETGRPARIEDYAGASGPAAEGARELGLRASVGMPIIVEGRTWGVMFVACGDDGPLPAGTEARLAGFSELAATAIANAQARTELRGFADEQAALRRVATLVAGAAPPEAVFTAVAEEVGRRLLEVDYTVLVRYDPNDEITIAAVWTRAGATAPTPVGSRLELGGRNVTSLVVRTGRSARIDDYTDASGAIGNVATRDWSFRSSAGVPISVEGRLWGVMVVGSRVEPLPADTEAGLAGFTELVGTAIANAQARLELRSYADEQAALRRVATLVARAAPPEQVFAAVTEEVGRALSADINVLARYDPDGTEIVLGIWCRTGTAPPAPVGSRFKLGGRNVTTLVFQTGQPARIDDYADSTGPVGEYSRDVGIRASVGVPISVEGRLWGVMLVTSARETPHPADTEARLAGFTELVATAIANAEAQAALTASRARIVATADATRRRIERDLHDGAQQRLVSLALQLRSTVQSSPPASAGALAAQMDLVADGLTGVLEELREIARGIHPAALAEGGLRSALKTLARRSAVPVRLDVGVGGRLPEPIELAAYYVVAEALTNAAKHGSATIIDVQVETSADGVHVRVRDDGRGGADLTSGTGLLGLTDRVEALGGRLSLHSSPGAGTTVQVVLPLTAPREEADGFVAGGVMPLVQPVDLPAQPSTPI